MNDIPHESPERARRSPRHARRAARRTFALAVVLLAACGARSGLEIAEPPPLDAPPIDAPRPDAGPGVRIPELLVAVTVDNSYRFGFGDERGLRSSFGAAEALSACDIFCCSAPCTADADCGGARCGPLGACEDGLGPEVYRVPEGAATGADFLYVVAWSDDSVTQGLLAEIRTEDGRVVRSGDDGWTVCATGVDYDAGGPGDAELTDWLGRCGRGETPSGGWVGREMSAPRLVVGETNADADGDFPETCPSPTFGDHISGEARWVWFDLDGRSAAGPFRTPQPEFLIFRLPTRAIVER